jgi:carboxypeptidase C (cathepsin A)
VFIESEGNPSTDPVILWSNGGPGASSLFGIMAELGPLLLNDDSLTGPVCIVVSNTYVFSLPPL